MLRAILFLILALAAGIARAEKFTVFRTDDKTLGVHPPRSQSVCRTTDVLVR